MLRVHANPASDAGGEHRGAQYSQNQAGDKFLLGREFGATTRLRPELRGYGAAGEWTPAFAPLRRGTRIDTNDPKPVPRVRAELGFVFLLLLMLMLLLNFLTIERSAKTRKPTEGSKRNEGLF